MLNSVIYIFNMAFAPSIKDQVYPLGVWTAKNIANRMLNRSTLLDSSWKYISLECSGCGEGRSGSAGSLGTMLIVSETCPFSSTGIWGNFGSGLSVKGA